MEKELEERMRKSREQANNNVRSQSRAGYRGTGF
jgi:hypothetical protein